MDQLRRAAEQAAGQAAQQRAQRAARNPQQQQQQQQQLQQQQQQSAAPPLSAKASETLMGPRTTDPVMSADGNHLAIRAPKGSRQMVLVDGVEGPVFDEAGRITNGPVQWEAVTLSPEGGRSAYVGRRGGEYIAVVDGKEAGTIMTNESIRGGQAMYSAGWKFWFSRDGSRLAYPVIDNGKWVMVIDGKKGPAYPGFDLKQSVMGGNRFAYYVNGADQKFFVVVDEKESAPYTQIQSLQVTPDGAHYAFVGTKVGKWVVVLDGVEGKEYSSISYFELMPNGIPTYIATKAGEPIQPGHGTSPQWLVVGDKEVDNDTRSFGALKARIQKQVALSQDGKHYAYLKKLPSSNGNAVFLDGKQVGPEYQTANELTFSPDGKRFAFFGQAPSGMVYPVVDGEEGEGFGRATELQFSSDSKHVGFVSFGGAPGGDAVTIDGKTDAKHQQVQADSLTFSPNGQHYVYGAAVNLTTIGVIMDGKATTTMLGSWRSRLNPNPPLTWPTFFYSPDGNHLAFMSQKTEGSGRPAVFVDDKAYEIQAATFGFPSFSSDGKHFAWLSYVNQKYVPFVDGKAGPALDDVLETNTAAYKLVDDHTVRYWGIKEGKIYRMTLDLNG